MHVMKKLNFKQVEMLWTVVAAGSISSAAKQLDVSQPAISRMLALTEEQVGIRFFDRIRGRLRPTKELTDLLPAIERAQLALQRVNDLTLSLADSSGGVLRVASNPSLGKHVMPHALAAFRATHPDTFLRFHTAVIQEVVPDLLNGGIDVALFSIPAEHPFLSSTTISVGSMVAIVSLDGPLADREKLSLEDIAPHPQILVGERLHFGMIVLSAFERAGLEPHVIADVPWSDLAGAMVNESMGCAIVDDFSVMKNTWPNVKVVPLTEPIPIRMHAVHSVTRPLPEIAKSFIRVVKGLYEVTQQRSEV